MVAANAHKKLPKNIFVGTASWNLRTEHHHFFAETGTHLEKYAGVFNGVELNSSFYKDPQPKTYAKWAACTPEHFRFSIKLSKRFTHEAKLQVNTLDLRQCLEGIMNLGEKFGVLLIQLPPKLEFQDEIANDFF